MAADTFEAREGWVPANTEGSVWCYRTRGNAGVLAFRRSAGGALVYEATHQDCYALDETITTTVRADAVRFAVAGAAAPPPPAAGAAPIEPAAPPAPAAPRPASSPEGDALRAAWQRYIEATSELLGHVEARLDEGAHAELVGRVGRALSLVREGALGSPASDAGDVAFLSATVGAVLLEARALVAASGGA